MLSHGKGAYVWDIQGRQWLDFTAGIAVNALGHGDDEFVKVCALILSLSMFVPQCGLGVVGIDTVVRSGMASIQRAMLLFSLSWEKRASGAGPILRFVSLALVHCCAGRFVPFTDTIR